MKRSQYKWCFDLTNSMAGWLPTLYDSIHPGQVRFCYEGYLIEPSSKAGLGASCLALKTAYQTRVWEQLDDDVQTGWVAHICSFQNQDNGYFEDPMILSVADYKANWSWLARNIARIHRKLSVREKVSTIRSNPQLKKLNKVKKKDWAVRRAETRQAAAALLAVGSAPLYPIKHIPTKPKEVLDFLDGLPWYRNPWHSGSHATYLIFALKLNADVFDRQAQFDEHVPLILSYLNRIQDPATGAWFRGSWFPRKVPLNQQINGAMKILTGYDLLKQPFRWPERLIDLCLSAFDDRDACHSVDVIFVLHQCALWTSYRRREIEVFAEKLLERIERHRKPDGGLSFFPDHTNTTYYDVPISRGLPESDVHGSHLLIWAATLCADLLGFKSELGWRFPVT